MTIPAQILKALNLDEGSYVQLSVEAGRIILESIELQDKISGKDFLAAMSNVVKAVERSTSTSSRMTDS